MAHKDHNQNYNITVENIGPIFKLNGNLSSNNQNLIFAANGTGKSFIARSLRILSQPHLDDQEKAQLPSLLVSEEADSGKASFQITRGEKPLGSINLDRLTKHVQTKLSDTIFHVFTEDYIRDHVTDKMDTLDQLEITHTIIIGKDNADIQEKEDSLKSDNEELNGKEIGLEFLFHSEKEKIQKQFSIRASLGAFKRLEHETYFSKEEFQPNQNQKNIEKLVESYNIHKSLPNEFAAPDEINFNPSGLDYVNTNETLLKITSPSTVAEKIKTRIASNQIFFETGVNQYKENTSECHFCRQPFDANAIDTITAYVKYFEDEEAKENKVIQTKIKTFEDHVSGMDALIIKTNKAISQYKELQKYFPSFAERNPIKIEPHLLEIQGILKKFVESLRQKSKNLSVEITPIENLIIEKENSISQLERENSKLYSQIVQLASNDKEERLRLQKDACSAFEDDFYIKNRSDIEEIRLRREKVNGQKIEIQTLKQTQGSKSEARTRIAETFSNLLKRFFEDKYTFDSKTFTLQRNQKNMPRGSEKTLSDGEKSVLAFCYFIAQIHLKVKHVSDYEKLFFVFDDPVSSLSYNYIYEICQCLKLLRIDEDGTIKFSIDSKLHRPRMLILTHNHYFYNIAYTNRVVKESALFQLSCNGNIHELKSQKLFANPHTLQLTDVYNISIGNKTPDHTTANSIRSVIEGMWKFCNPNLDKFADFVQHLISTHNIEIKSVLINNFSHGGHTYEILPGDAYMREAAIEAIEIVNKFAPGQILGIMSKQP